MENQKGVNEAKRKYTRKGEKREGHQTRHREEKKTNKKEGVCMEESKKGAQVESQPAILRRGGSAQGTGDEAATRLFDNRRRHGSRAEGQGSKQENGVGGSSRGKWGDHVIVRHGQ